MLKSKNKLLHKALAFVLTFSLLATLVSFNFTASAEITGNGTAASPYEINSEETLIEFKTQVESGNTGAYAKLTASFTVNSDWTPIGGSDALTTYTGVFDGGNYAITFNNSMTDGEYVGLFASNAGTIKNLTVDGTVSSSTALAFVGGIAGKNSGDIINCKNSIDFTASGKNAVVGGITAVSSGKVSNCENTAAISITTATSEGTVVDKEATAGGIVGLNLNGTVEKSTNKGTVSNTDSNGYAGGIVGCNYGTINNCLNTNSVSNDNSSYAGGIAGYLFKEDGEGDATISNSLNTIDNGNIIGSNGLNDNSHIGTITNCFYKGNDDSIDGTTIVNDLTTGEVTYRLNKGNVSDPVWGQKISDTTNDPNPVIGITETSDNIVYANTENTGYTNNKPQCTNHQYDNGVCTVCGDVAAKLVGYTLVDDGVLGMNYYYKINVSTENATPTVNFTISGRTIEATGTKVDNIDKYNYKFTVNVNSDEMTRDITAKLTVGDINVTNSNYSVADYLESLYLDPTSYLSNDELAKAAELQTLAKAMLTYDYYSNMYFKYYEDLGLTVSEPKMGLADLEDSTTLKDSLLSSYKPSINEAQTGKTLQHNATTVQLLDETYLRNIVTGNYDGTVYVGYKKTADSTYTYAEATKTTDGYWGATAKIPAAELDCKYQMFFSSAKSDDENSKLSVIKTAGPYSYVYTVLNAYKDNPDKTDIVNLVKALYNYGEAAKAYYTTTNA